MVSCLEATTSWINHYGYRCSRSFDSLRRLRVSTSPLQETTLSHISHPYGIQRVGYRRAYPASDAVHHTSTASDYLNGEFRRRPSERCEHDTQLIVVTDQLDFELQVIDLGLREGFALRSPPVAEVVGKVYRRETLPPHSGDRPPTGRGSARSTRIPNRACRVAHNSVPLVRRQATGTDDRSS